ncbi:TetR/AcrR family transcriptional regulator [Nocardia sp. IFM 10818]
MQLDPPVTQRLRPGPSALSRAEVLASQRGRLALAALQTVAAAGYQPTTIADITKRAQVSKRTFYELFRSKEECFLAGLEGGVAVAQHHLDEALEPADRLDWRRLVRRSLTVYLELLAAEPDVARALHLEAVAAGGEIAHFRARMNGVFVDRMRGAHRVGVEQGELSGEPAEGMLAFLIGGIDDRIRQQLIASGPEDLPALGPDICAAAIAILRMSGTD